MRTSGVGDPGLRGGFHGDFPSGWAHYGRIDTTMAESLRLADIDGDGIDDELLSAHFEGGRYGGLCVGRGGLGDSFGEPAVAWNGRLNQLPVVPEMASDYSGDGKLDYVGGGRLYCGYGDLTFAPGPMFQPPGLPAADFNGDGKLDLIEWGKTSITIYLNAN